jgi:hypothetical protein
MLTCVGTIGSQFGTDSVASVPNAPTISVVAGETSLTVTISGDAGVTHHPLYRKTSQYAWIEASTRVGDGDVVISSLSVGNYEVIVYSDNAGIYGVPSDSKTVKITGTTSFAAGTTVTLTASKELFEQGHVADGVKIETGALFQICHNRTSSDVQKDFTTVSSEETSDSLTVYRGQTWDYSTDGGWTGTIKLQKSYDEGASWSTVVVTTSSAGSYNSKEWGTEETDDAVYRIYTEDVSGATAVCHISVRESLVKGIVEIKSVTSPTIATGTVLTALASSSPTYRWSEGLFSEKNGRPSCGVITTDQRLAVAGAKKFPLTVAQSRNYQYTDMMRGTLLDDARVDTISNNESQNKILWILPKKNTIIGTSGGEHEIERATSIDVVPQANILGSEGSENIQAISAGNTILFIKRGGLRLMELSYDLQQDSMVAVDLTVFSRHITQSGIKQIAFQRTPEPTLWLTKNNGEMVCFSYRKIQQDFYAWARRTTLNGIFETHTVVYGGRNNEDEVWVGTRRLINGVYKQFIERMKPIVPKTDTDIFYVDCGLSRNGSPVSSISIPHLAGEQVDVVGDGFYLGRFTASSTGAITLPNKYSKIHAGLPMTSVVRPTRPDMDVASGAVKNTHKIYANLYETYGGKYGKSLNKLWDIKYFTNAPVYGDTVSFFTGTKELEMPSDWDRDEDVYIVQDKPLPMTLLGLTYSVSANPD